MDVTTIKPLNLTNAQWARMFGCTVEQVRANHAENARRLLPDIAKAERTGKKVRQYTLEQLREQYARLVRNSTSD